MNTTDQQHYDNDEIDLIELFRKLWAERLVVVLITAIGVFLAGGLFLNTWLKQPLFDTVTLEVRFNFPSIQNGTYPNGQVFSLNDLVAPAILNQVYVRYKLEEYGLSRNDFIQAVQIMPFATNREFIEARFKGALDNKKLSAAEIDELNANYTAALEVASRRFARLTFSLETSLVIPKTTMMAVLGSIPGTWARESIENYGVLDIASASIGELDKALIENYEYLVSAQYLSDYLAYITNSAKALQVDEVGRLLVDSETSLNIDDVLEELSNLREFHVNVLQRSFAVVPVVRNSEEASFYLNNQIIVEEEKLDQLNRQAAVVDQAYQQLLSSDRNTPPNTPSTTTQQGYPTQYGDEFLTRLMSIGDELSESKFKQSLLNRSIELKLEAEKVITRINSLKKNLGALEARGDENIIVKNRVDFEVKNITQKLERLGKVINRLASLRSERVLGRSGTLYDLNSEPRVIGNFIPKLKNLIGFLIFGAIAGLFLGLFVALIMAVMKGSREHTLPLPRPADKPGNKEESETLRAHSG